MKNPNAYLFSSGGDGIKNYFTYASHIKNNPTLLNFEGLNYPYGENILYTDGHPLFIAILKPLQSIFPDLAHYHIGILNFLMLLSLFIGGIFLFKIFKHLKIESWYSSIIAFSIMCLAPQVFRFNGHLSLSYACFLPIGIYLLLRLYQTNYNKKYIILLTANIISWLFIHAYLGAILLALLISFEAIQLFARKKNSLKKRLLILFPLLLPILIFYWIKALGEPHLNRSTKPYGFFEYYADFDTIILPNHPPLKALINQLLPSFSQSWEGWSYIGIGTILLSIIALVLFLKKHPFFKAASYSALEAIFLKKLFLAALLVLLFSFGYPFRWGLESLLDYFPFLQQFRSIGRFAWLFYFSISITSAYFLYHIGTYLSSKALRKGIYLLFPLLMIIESFAYHQEVGFQSSQSPNYFSKYHISQNLLEEYQRIKQENYQALIPLPFYCLGSENHEREASNSIYQNSMLASYHLELPILGNHLSRSSIREGRNMLQLLAPPYYEKWIQKDMSSKKQFLILKGEETLKADEEELLNRAKFLFKSEQYAYYEISYDSLFKTNIQDELLSFLGQKDQYISKPPYWLSDDSKFYHEHTTALQIDKNGEHSIFNIQSKELLAENSYEVSLWIYCGGENFGQDQLNYLNFELRESLNDEIIQHKSVEVMQGSTLFEEWSRVELRFKVQNSKSQVEFILIGNDPRNKPLDIMDFLLKTEKQTIFWQDSEAKLLHKNNHRLKYSADSL